MVDKFIQVLSWLALGFLCLILCCQPDRSIPDLSCETVEAILETDQLYRQKYSDVFMGTFQTFDSLIKDAGVETGYKGKDELAQKVLDSLSNKANILNLDKHGLTQHQWDSIWDLQEEIDRENTLTVIGMIEKEVDSVWFTQPFDCARKSFFVFLHCPEDLMDDVKTAIDQVSLQEKDRYQYRHIMWHLTGRESFPGEDESD